MATYTGDASYSSTAQISGCATTDATCLPTQTKTGPDGKSATHEVKPADVHWIDAKVTHTLTNAGTGEGQIVEIELK